MEKQMIYVCIEQLILRISIKKKNKFNKFEIQFFAFHNDDTYNNLIKYSTKKVYNLSSSNFIIL